MTIIVIVMMINADEASERASQRNGETRVKRSGSTAALLSSLEGK